MTLLAVFENEAMQLPMTELLKAMEPEADLMCFGSALPALAAARKREDRKRNRSRGRSL